MNFTTTALASLIKREAGTRAVVHDKGQTALLVELRESGSLTFYLYARIDGPPRRVRLGRFPELSIDAARKLAKQHLGDITHGINPAAKRAASRRESTLADVWTWYLESHAKPKKRSWQGDQWLYDRYLAKWASRRLSEITREDVIDWHVRIGKKHGVYGANRALALLSAVFNKATGKGWDGGNPAHGVERFDEEQRERFLQPHELAKFLEAVDAEPVDFRDFFRLCLLTGARRGNVQSMRWDEIDAKACVWSIPQAKAKGKRVIHVPLLPAAVEVLAARRGVVDGSEWVFPSRSKTGHLVEVKSSWSRICKAAKLTDLRVHDLRRSVGSWLAASGVGLPIIGKLLGHQSPSTTAIYARLGTDTVRAALASVGTLMGSAGMEGNANGET